VNGATIAIGRNKRDREGEIEMSKMEIRARKK
jgi:hypothetical protein